MSAEQTPQPKTFNEWADFWRNVVGVNVIPADTRKKSTYISWKQYQDAPIPLETHEQWKAEDAFRNGMAVIAGRVWHNYAKKDLFLICVDLDNLKAIDEFAVTGLPKLAAHVIVEQHSDNRNKAHVYFYATKPFPKKSSDMVNPDLAAKIARDEVPAIEVKGLGLHGISYCTPSLHQNGHPYQIIGALEPATVNDFESHIDSICKKYGISYLDAAASNGSGGTTSITTVTDLWKADAKVLEGHNRHEALMRIMESLLKRCPDYDEEILFEIARLKNQKMCVPPLPDDQVTRQWKAAKEFIIRHFDPSQFKNIVQREADETNDEHIQRLVNILMSMYHFATMKDTEDVLVYNEGKYDYLGESTIKVESEKMWPDVTTHYRNEIIDHIRARTMLTRDGFDPDLDIINVKNGLLNMITGEFKPHTPEYKSVIQIPVVYNPSAKCPNIIKYFTEVLYLPNVKTALAIIAFCLWRTMSIQRAVMLWGSGSNGKSVFIELIKRFLGKVNVSSIGLQQLEEDRFAGAQLYGKLANLHADVSSRTIESTGIFKMLVAGDSLTVQRKHQHPFEFNNYAKLIFSANKVPESSDESDAYFRRWIILPFPRSFDKSKADINLIEKLTTEEELSGLLNLVLPFCKYIRKYNIPEEQHNIEDIKVVYMRASNPIKAFLKEATKIGGDGYELKEDVWKAYDKYCTAHKLAGGKEKAFYQALKDEGIQETRPTIKDKDGKTSRPHCFALKLKDWKVVEDDDQSALDSFG